MDSHIMLGAIIGDVAGSTYEISNLKSEGRSLPSPSR